MIREKLKSLNIELPQISPPIASYIPAKLEGNHIWISGQLPVKEGKLLLTGALSSEEEIPAAYEAMGQCFLNAIAAASNIVDIDKIKGVLKLTAFVASKENFYAQHLVANGASDLARKIFGEEGIHIRSAVGVISLPLNASVELEVIFIL